MSTKKIVITRVLTPSSLLSHDVQDKLQTTGKLLDDLQEVQSARLSHRPEGPGGPTPEAAIRPSSQEKIIGKNPSARNKLMHVNIANFTIIIRAIEICCVRLLRKHLSIRAPSGLAELKYGTASR